VLALTISNVFLTLRLLQSDCGHHLNNEQQQGTSLPRVPAILTPATCLEYILSDSNGNVSEKAVFSGLDLKLGRWDQRRMFKIFDFAIHGERYTDVSEKLNVTLATQSSIEKIFSLVQGSILKRECERAPFNNSCTRACFPFYIIVSHHWTGPISIAGTHEKFISPMLNFLNQIFLVFALLYSVRRGR
jgi:hypothetical protein